MFAETQTFSSFAVDDLSRAAQFYGETLGLRTTDHVPEMPLLTLHLAGDRDLMIYEKPDFQPATYTVLNFAVDDVEAAVDGLTEKGIEMERYDGFVDQDERGIAREQGGPDIGWFKDPAGNILSVVKEP